MYSHTKNQNTFVSLKKIYTLLSNILTKNKIIYL